MERAQQEEDVVQVESEEDNVLMTIMEGIASSIPTSSS